MIVECYTADVYCDDPEHKYGSPGCCTTPAVFNGPNKRYTDRKRRDSGWVKLNDSDICPSCKKRLCGK